MQELNEELNPNIVLIQYINGPNLDTLHGVELTDDEIGKAVGPIADSSSKFGVPVYLLTNSKMPAKVDNVNTVSVDLFNYEWMSVYNRRIELTYKYLLEHPELNKVAFVDAGDVEMCNYPFDQVEDDKLYMGMETFKLKDFPLVKDVMQGQYVYDFIMRNGHLWGLNSGVIVGSRSVMIEFFGMLTRLITDAKVFLYNGQSEFDLGHYEMGLMNYVAYKYFSDRLVIGRQVTSKFTSLERRSSAWFRHK